MSETLKVIYQENLLDTVIAGIIDNSARCVVLSMNDFTSLIKEIIRIKMGDFSYVEYSSLEIMKARIFRTPDLEDGDIKIY